MELGQDISAIIAIQTLQNYNTKHWDVPHLLEEA